MVDNSVLEDKSYIVYENVKTQLTCTTIGGYPYPEISIAFASINARTPEVICCNIYNIVYHILKCNFRNLITQSIHRRLTVVSTSL